MCGQKHVHVVNSSEKKTTTCASASGYILPPMIVYKRKKLTPQLRAGEVDGLSPSDWEPFHQWFHIHLLQYAPAVRPLLLLLDGYSSHYRLEFIREASTQGVIVFCLSPNTTHVCQSKSIGTACVMSSCPPILAEQSHCTNFVHSFQRRGDGDGS